MLLFWMCDLRGVHTAYDIDSNRTRAKYRRHLHYARRHTTSYVPAHPTSYDVVRNVNAPLVALPHWCELISFFFYLVMFNVCLCERAKHDVPV